MRKFPYSIVLLIFLLIINVVSAWEAIPAGYLPDLEISINKITKTQSSTLGYYINFYVNVWNNCSYWIPDAQLRLFRSDQTLADIEYFTIEPYQTLVFLLRGYLSYYAWRENNITTWYIKSGRPDNDVLIVADSLEVVVDIRTIQNETNPTDPSSSNNPNDPSYLPDPKNPSFPTSQAINLSSDWQFLGSEGDWLYYSPILWETPYSNVYSKFMYGIKIQNFQHFKAIVYLENYDIGGYWEISKGHQLVSFIFKGNSTIIAFVVDHQLRIHLLGYKDVLTSCSAINLNNLDEGLNSISVMKNMYVEIHAWKNSENQLVLAYMYRYDPTDVSATVFQETVLLDIPQSFFNNVTIIEVVEKGLEFGGSCSFKGGLADLNVTSGSGLSQAPYQAKELSWLEIYRKNWWFIDQLYQLGSFLWSMLILLWNIVIPCLPLLFSVYVFYLLYLVLGSMEDGDFHKIYDHFIKIAQLFVSIAQAIYQGINTILSHFKV